MNTAMVKRLILKDWYFQRWTLVAYLVAGVLALALIGKGGEGPFFAGATLLVTVLIAIGIHLTMATVVDERKEQTLSFVMSLPISVREYTLGKMGANLLIFFIAWATMLLGSFAVIAGSPLLPDGMIPFSAVMLGEIFVSTCLILAVALVSESQAWTVGAIVVGNLGFNGFLYFVAHIPTIAKSMKLNSILWNRPTVLLLFAEIAASALLLGGTFALQARKKDFI
jgi:ABC-type transport system involved in multi-copper enzyme maturation permease subunit